MIESIALMVLARTDWSSLIQLMGTPAAILTFVAACFALFYNASAGHAQLFLTLRERHGKIQKEMPKGPSPARDYHDPNWWPNPTVENEQQDYATIERYWYQTFDEWFTTKKMHPLWFKPLWTKFYKKAIYKGLRSRPIRRVLYLMIKNKRSSFSGLDEEFVTDMEALYKRFTVRSAHTLEESRSEHAAPPKGVVTEPERHESNPCPGFEDKTEAEYQQLVKSVEDLEIFRCCKYPGPESRPSEPSKASQANDSSSEE